ncbi:saccharopine dehydrogenase NADP-binding domain-containing protein [Nonomuraea sp. NPDC050556]|uniref:saccharopine dehydrogenase NADP-binding domain-containing protein n=1 Tax=Nonomuraea sp. NPDC050556 TaxID=3364369 RepID=UPI00378C25AF
MRIVVYGANGFQGRLMLAELVRRGVEPVLAGRDSERLKHAAAGAETVVADVDDHRALVAAFHGAQVVVNCAGPFTPSGGKVIAAALAAGCHYVDTSGEQAYLHEVHQTFGARAERVGVSVVPAMTDSGVPGDLLAALLAERLGPLESLTALHRFAGFAMSRGSLRTLASVQGTVEGGGLGYDGGRWHDGPMTAAAPLTLPGRSTPTEVIRFPLQEVVFAPRHVRVASVYGVAEAELAAVFATPIPAEVVDTLPEGPDDETRAAQRWTVLIDAVARDGRAARGIAEGQDTYGTTAVIAVAGALHLAAGASPAGVLTPAQAVDPAAFLNSLAPHGCAWSIQPG